MAQPEDKDQELRKILEAEADRRYDNLTRMGHTEKQLMKDSFVEGALYTYESIMRGVETINNEVAKRYKVGM